MRAILQSTSATRALPGAHDSAPGLGVELEEWQSLDPARERSPAVGDWLLWQLMDSAFPTGGYAHSSGLEAAWQHGEVRNSQEFLSFLGAALQQLGQAVLPFVTAAHGHPHRLSEFDQLCDAFTSNHVANRASRLQGRAFLSAVTRIFVSDSFPAAPTCGHFAPVFGATTRALGVPRETTSRLFFFNHLRGLLAAAVRLNIVGSMAGQRIQHGLATRAEEILEQCAALDLDDLAQTAPLLDVWQGAHDRLYSRLFQS
jgi:urease accessory protein